MSGKNSVVSMTLQLNGKQAQQVLQQFLQTQKTSAAEILRTNRNLEGVLRQQAQQTSIQAKQYQQMSRLVQQQHSALAQSTVQTQATLRTNQLLERVLQQQVRQSTLLRQNNRNQNRDYQIQLNTLRQQVAAAERLRQQLEQAGRANRDMNRGNSGGIGGNAIQNTTAIAGATYAAGSIVSNYLDDPRQYMKQISLATDTALAGQKMSIDQFNSKVSEMEGFVRNSTISGGSSPTQMVSALNTLTASNVFDFDELKHRMLQVSRTAFASGADADDIAKMTIAQRNFGLTDLEKANDQAMKAGQLGSFELRDMARYMPDLLTQGKGAGYIGDKGYRSILSMMQLSKKTAGTADSAAINLSDLLGSFSQHHLGLQFAKFVKLDKGDPIAAYGVSKKRVGFDWTTYAANMQSKGIGEVEAAAIIMNRQMEKNPIYRKYREQAQTALKNKNDAEYIQNLEAATQIAAQSEIGKIFHNKQGLMAFMGVTMNSQEGGFKEQLDKGILDSEGAIETSHQRQSAQEYGKDGSLDTARFNARVDVYNGNAGWLGNLKQGLADFASSNAGIAAAASAAVLGLTAVGVAGGVAALAMRTGGGGMGAATGAASGATMGAIRSVGQAGLAGVLGYGIGTAARNGYMTTEAGRNFDENLGEVVAKVWQYMPDWMGGEAAKSAVEAQAKYDEMIKQQQEANQHSRETNKNFNTLIGVVKNSQSIVPNLSQLFGQQNISPQPQQSAVGERHGVVPFMLQKR